MVSVIACRDRRAEPSDAAIVVATVPVMLDAAIEGDAPLDAAIEGSATLDAAIEGDAPLDAQPKPTRIGCAACSATQYCIRKDTIVHGWNYGLQSTTACERLPAQCATKPSCACVVRWDSPANCTVVDGQVRVWFPARNP
jgi:hypothetical protein